MLENLKTRILAMVLLYIVCKLTEKLNLNDFSAANAEIFAKKSLLFWFLFCFYLFIYFWSGEEVSVQRIQLIDVHVQSGTSLSLMLDITTMMKVLVIHFYLDNFLKIQNMRC